MRTYGKLREKIRKVFGSIGDFSEAMGRDRSTMSKKLNGYVPWDQVEMEKASQLLGFSVEDIPDYFFYEA